MAARFYAPDLNPSQQVARLPADEAHHLVKVLRLGAWRDRRRVRRSWQRMAGSGGNSGTRRRRSIAARAGAGAAPGRRYHAGSGRAQRRADGRRRPRLHDGGHRCASACSDSADYRQDIRRHGGPGAMAASRARISQAMRRCQAARHRRSHYLRGLAPTRARFQSAIHSRRTVGGRGSRQDAPAGVTAGAVARDVDCRTRRRLDRR